MAEMPLPSGYLLQKMLQTQTEAGYTWTGSWSPELRALYEKTVASQGEFCGVLGQFSVEYRKALLTEASAKRPHWKRLLGEVSAEK